MEIVLYLIFIIWVYIFFVRNFQVYRFRGEIIEMVYSPGIEWEKRREIYRRVSYEKMLFSIKPLKLKYWFTDYEIKQLTTHD